MTDLILILACTIGAFGFGILILKFLKVLDETFK